MARQISGINDIPTILDQNKTNGMNEQEEKMISQSKEERMLNNAIYAFYKDKQEFDRFKNYTDELNKEIKKLMQKLNKTEFETDNGLVAKISIQNRESFNEEKLIEKIRSFNLKGYDGLEKIIKIKEYIDMDELEDAIYQGNLDASELTNCKISKEVVTLKVTERK